jgi:hypothetical protein
LIIINNLFESKLDEEGRLQPTQAGHPQLATPLFLSPHDILKKKNLRNL